MAKRHSHSGTIALQSGPDADGPVSTTDQIGVSSSDRCAIGYARHENFLQHVALDGLLQNRNIAKSRVDAVDDVTGYENERHAAHPENFGDGIYQSVTEIDVE